MEESVRFYVEGIGFRMTQKWVDEGKLRWRRLEAGGAALRQAQGRPPQARSHPERSRGAALMLQEFPKEGHDAWAPEGKVGEGVSVCFICEDALAIYHQVSSRGIHAARPFVGNAMWVTSLSDPDGYRIDFESPTEAPEESEYQGSEG